MARKWLILAAVLCLALQAVAEPDAAEATAAEVAEPAATKATVAADGAATKGAAADADEYSVLTLHDNKDVKMDEFTGVFAALGVPAEHAQMIAQTVSAKGTAAVLEGPKSSLEKICELFGDINIKCEVAAKPGGPPAAAGAAAGAQRPAPKSPFDGSSVSVLDAAGFQKEVMAAESTPTLVMFFAPWCGHCHTAAPELIKTAQQLAGKGVNVAAVDCDAAPEVARALGIKGYPTIQFFAGGKGADYQGPRTSLALTAFAQNQAKLAGVKAIAGKAMGSLKMAASKVLGADKAAPVAAGAVAAA